MELNGTPAFVSTPYGCFSESWNTGPHSSVSLTTFSVLSLTRPLSLTIELKMDGYPASSDNPHRPDQP